MRNPSSLVVGHECRIDKVPETKERGWEFSKQGASLCVADGHFGKRAVLFFRWQRSDEQWSRGKGNACTIPELGFELLNKALNTVESCGVVRCVKIRICFLVFEVLPLRGAGCTHLVKRINLNWHLRTSLKHQLFNFLMVFIGPPLIPDFRISVPRRHDSTVWSET